MIELFSININKVSNIYLLLFSFLIFFFSSLHLMSLFPLSFFFLYSLHLLFLDLTKPSFSLLFFLACSLALFLFMKTFLFLDSLLAILFFVFLKEY